MDFDLLPGVFQLDWMTAASTVPASSGSIWHGSLTMGRFERAGSNGAYRVLYLLDPGGRHCLVLSGEKLLRCGIRWEEVLGDVWGPSVAIGAQRLDWAWEYQGERPVDLAWLALEVSRRLPPVRYGWDTWSVFSPGGTTYYYGMLSQAGTDDAGKPKDRLSRAMSKPLLIRIYQKVGQRPRVEAECKKLSGESLREALRQTEFLASSFMPGRPSWTIERAQLGAVALDGRADPKKLVRQAYGLMRAAGLRTGVTPDGWLERDAELQRLWVEVVHRCTGLSWEQVKPKGQPRLPPSRAPGAVKQGCEEGGLDLASVVPMVHRGEGEPTSSPLGAFYEHFCKGGSK